MQARVAVVDDDAENCEALSELLRAEGFDVISFPSAEAAWSAIRAGLAVPDAVVADVRMPGIDGVTLLAALKRDYPETPVVLVSAFPDESVWREARRLGATEVFPKPIHGHGLAEVLRSAIAPRRTPSTR